MSTALRQNERECRMIRVLVIHGNPLFSLGIHATLERHGMQIVGETIQREEILEMVASEHPDVVLFDGALTFRDAHKQYSAAEVVSHIRKISTGGIIVLVPEAFEEQLFHFLLAGAAAYELDRLDCDRFLETVRLCAQGQYLITSEVLPPETLKREQRKSPLQAKTRISPTPQAPQGHVTPSEKQSQFGLTRRHIEILQCVLHGLTNKQIAKRLAIRQDTVKNHMNRMLRLLCVRDRTAAVVTALSYGLITFSDALPSQVTQMPEAQDRQQRATSHAAREEVAV